MVFGAGLSVGVYVFAHAIDALQAPVLKHLGIVLEAALANADFMRMASMNCPAWTYAAHDRDHQYQTHIIELNVVRAQIKSNAQSLEEIWGNLPPGGQIALVKAWGEELTAAYSAAMHPPPDFILELIDEDAIEAASPGTRPPLFEVLSSLLDKHSRPPPAQRIATGP